MAAVQFALEDWTLVVVRLAPRQAQTPTRTAMSVRPNTFIYFSRHAGDFSASLPRPAVAKRINFSALRPGQLWDLLLHCDISLRHRGISRHGEREIAAAIKR